MDKQIKYLLGVLILLLILTYFMSLLSGLPQYFKEDIIAFLEARFSGEISFSSVSLWPLNRLRLNSFSFKDENGNEIKMEQLNLDYNFNFTELDNLIEIKLIEALNAEIVITEKSLAAISNNGVQNLKSKEKNLEAQNLKLSTLNLPKYLQNINVNILDSKLRLATKDFNFELDKFNLGISAENRAEYKLNLATAAKINHISYNDFVFKDLKIENIELNFTRNKQQADLYFNTSSLALKPFLTLLKKDSYSYQNFKLDLNSAAGEFQAKGEVEIKDNRLLDYKTEITAAKLIADTAYQQNNIKENLTLEFNDLNLFLSGPKFKLAAVDNQVLIDNQKLQFSLKINPDLNYKLKLRADNFEYDYDFLAPELTKADLAFNLNLEGKQNELKRASAEIKAKNIENKYLTVADSQFILQLKEDQLFIEKAEFEFKDNAIVKAKASYNLEDSGYLLTAESKDIKISTEIISLLEEYQLADNYLAEVKKIENDKLGFTVDVAGDYNLDNGISAAGDLSFNFNLENKSREKNHKIEVESAFWYTKKKLFFDFLKINSDFLYLDLMGELDFAAENFDLRYAASNLELAEITEIAELDLEILSELDPTINYLEGQITNRFSNPKVTMDLNLEKLNYQNYSLADIEARINYEDYNLNLIDLKAAVNQATVRAQGEIENLLEKAKLDLELKSENLYFEDLSYLLGEKLPLSGELQLNADLSGPLDDYKFNFAVNTSNTVFNYENENYEISNLTALVTKNKDNFHIEDFSFEHQDLIFNASGVYNLKSGFDLSYQLDGFEFKNYLNKYPQRLEEISGSLSLKGQLKGMIQKASLDFKINDENIYYNGFNIDIKENKFRFNLEENRINIDKFNFNIASGTYQLTGEIFDLNSKPKSKLKLNFVEVPIKEYFEEYLGLYPFPKNIVLKGENQLTTEGNNYNAAVNINGYLNGENKNSFTLKGNLNHEIDLNFEAEELPLAYSSTDYDFNLDLESSLNFNGSITGSIDNPILNLNHTLNSLAINNTALESITGNILIENDRKISASEKVKFLSGGNLDLDLSYSISEQQLNLTSSLEELPLSFILSFFGDSISSDGQINGNLRAEGKLAELQLSGDLKTAGEFLELGIWAPIKNFSGKVELTNEAALVKDFKGQFVDGDFQLGGKFNLFDLENFWELSLKGQNLFFDYGSLEGNFDSQVTFAGAVRDPLLKGEIRAYDFKVGIPFEWPAGNGEAAPDSFVPRIDLKIIPENNLRVKNKNMDVLIENGDLNINFNHRRENTLMMEGRLNSTQGRFKYYNSRFTLNNAEAVFTPVDEDDIPTLQANATTYAGGREININVNGPVNNMRISFVSDPEMTEEEILNLLSSEGALGSAIIGGEDIGVQDIIMQELIRVVNGFLQEDIISDLESDFRSVLSLDRIEIDAYQYGLEREFAIYLGKNISERFYLEYAGFFGEEERENEISFQYQITETTNLKGTYFGDDEYQITLENEIEF